MNKISEIETKKFLKKIFGTGFITLISRISGLAREITITTFLGTSFYSDSFYLAFTIPNLFRRFTAEGSMFASFLPILTEIHEKKNYHQAQLFVRNFFWLFFSFLVIFAIFFIITVPWTVPSIFATGFEGAVLEKTIFLTQLMFSYIIFISLAAFFQAILNYHSSFLPSAFTPLLFNICFILGGFIAGKIFNQALIGLSLGVLIGGLIQFIFQYPFVKKQGYVFLKNTQFFDPYVKKTLLLMFPGLLGAGIYQLNLVISNTIATTLYPGALTSLVISNRLIELVLGVVVVSITTVLLPSLSKLVIKQKFQEANQKLQDTLLLSSFITLPISIGLIFLGKEIIQILFLRGEFNQRSLELTFQALIFHSPGLFFIAWNRIFNTSFQSLKMLKLTAYLAFLALLVNASIAWYGSKLWGHSAIASASTTSQILLSLLSIFYMPKILKKFINKNLFFSLSKQLFAATIMAFSLWLVKSFFYEKYLWFNFFLSSFIAISTYLFISYILKIEELRKIFVLLKKSSAHS